MIYFIEDNRKHLIDYKRLFSLNNFIKYKLSSIRYKIVCHCLYKKHYHKSNKLTKEVYKIIGDIIYKTPNPEYYIK